MCEIVDCGGGKIPSVVRMGGSLSQSSRTFLELIEDPIVHVPFRIGEWSDLASMVSRMGAVVWADVNVPSDTISVGEDVL